MWLRVHQVQFHQLAEIAPREMRLGAPLVLAAESLRGRLIQQQEM